VDAIAAEAGVSKQTIYNHFGDKAHLFRAVMHATVAETGAGMGPPPGDDLAESDDLDRDLRRFARRLARSVLAPDIAAMRRVLIAELDRHPELMEEWGTQGRELHRMLATAFARLNERGVVDVPDPMLAAQQLVLLTAGNAMTLSRFGTDTPPGEALDKAVDDGVQLWLRAYAVRPTDR
jgi:AcrR family transcriptional regulator